MPVEVLNPEGLSKPDMYRQVVDRHRVTARVHRRTGGPRRRRQRRRCRRSRGADRPGLPQRRHRIEAVGGSFADIAKLTVYVVDWSPEKMAALGEGVGRAAATATIDPLKPITLIGVAALGEPDILIEVEAIASLS